MLQTISSWADRWFVLVVSVAALLGMIFPEYFLWMGVSWDLAYWGTINGVLIGLGVIMFGMGMTLSIEDLRESYKNPERIVIGTTIQYILMPILSFLLVILLDLPSIVGVGIIIVGCCPGGTASNVIAYLSGADVPLSVSITLLSTLIAPVLTPWLIWLLAQKLLGFYRGFIIDVPVILLFKAVLIVIIPIIIGLIMKQQIWSNQTIPKIEQFFTLLSITVIALIVAYVVGNAASENSLLSSGVLIIAVIVHNIFGLIGGYTLSRLLCFPEDAARSISIEVGMQNSGLGVAIASILSDTLIESGLHSAEQLALLGIPAVLFSVWHNISGSVLASYWKRESMKA